MRRVVQTGDADADATARVGDVNETPSRDRDAARLARVRVVDVLDRLEGGPRGRLLGLAHAPALTFP